MICMVCLRVSCQMRPLALHIPDEIPPWFNSTSFTLCKFLLHITDHDCWSGFPSWRVGHRTTGRTTNSTNKTISGLSIFSTRRTLTCNTILSKSPKWRIIRKNQLFLWGKKTSNISFFRGENIRVIHSRTFCRGRLCINHIAEFTQMSQLLQNGYPIAPSPSSYLGFLIPIKYLV